MWRGRFADIALKAALKPLGDLVSGAVESLFTATNPALGGVTRFRQGRGARGAEPISRRGAGLGVAGEAGPEAILPLARGAATGGLGVARRQAAATVNVTFNVTAERCAQLCRRRGGGQRRCCCGRSQARAARAEN